MDRDAFYILSMLDSADRCGSDIRSMQEIEPACDVEAPCFLPSPDLWGSSRDGVKGSREYAIMVLLAYYGLRVGDIVTLRLDDIHWRQAEILIQQGKTDRPLLLPLVDEVAEALLDYLQLRPRCEHREVFLRLSVYGPPHPLGRARISHMVQDAMTRAGIQWTRGMAAYTLRHSFATHRVRIGLPLKTVGDCLGHTTTSTTFIYTKLAVEDLRSVCLDPQELLG